jgi:hypothetical protein
MNGYEAGFRIGINVSGGAKFGSTRLVFPHTGMGNK